MKINYKIKEKSIFDPSLWKEGDILQARKPYDSTDKDNMAENHIRFGYEYTIAKIEICDTKSAKDYKKYHVYFENNEDQAYLADSFIKLRDG